MARGRTQGTAAVGQIPGGPYRAAEPFCPKHGRCCYATASRFWLQLSGRRLHPAGLRTPHLGLGQHEPAPQALDGQASRHDPHHRPFQRPVHRRSSTALPETAPTILASAAVRLFLARIFRCAHAAAWSAEFIAAICSMRLSRRLADSCSPRMDLPKGLAAPAAVRRAGAACPFH